jgi:D-alanyl-D-alanine carboxypeptidase
LHAPEFSFTMSYPERNSHGYEYEPWHWCFRETEV